MNLSTNGECIVILLIACFVLIAGLFFLYYMSKNILDTNKVSLNPVSANAPVSANRPDLLKRGLISQIGFNFPEAKLMITILNYVTFAKQGIENRYLALINNFLLPYVKY